MSEKSIISRRKLLVNGTKLVAASSLALPAYLRLAGQAHADPLAAGVGGDYGHQYVKTNFEKVNPKWKRQMVRYFSSEPPGTIVIDTNHHYLYYVWENNTAIRYGIAVGKEGFKWYGRARINRKARYPRWVPPKAMRERHPELPEKVEGGIKNPLGPRVMYLANENGDTGYRIHGTQDPSSVGRDASSGCIRMYNENAIDLYRRAPVGTPVLVLQHIQERADKIVDPS